MPRASTSSYKSVSVVTRSAYGDEQFSELNSTRVNRHAGQPGHGVEPGGNWDTQRFTHLSHCPPHRFSNGLAFMLSRNSGRPR